MSSCKNDVKKIKMIFSLILLAIACSSVLADTYEIKASTLYYSPTTKRINEKVFANATRDALQNQIDRFVLPKMDYEAFPQFDQYCDGKKGFLLDFSYSHILNFTKLFMISNCIGGGI